MIPLFSSGGPLLLQLSKFVSHTFAGSGFAYFLCQWGARYPLDPFRRIAYGSRDVITKTPVKVKTGD